MLDTLARIRILALLLFCLFPASLFAAEAAGGPEDTAIGHVSRVQGTSFLVRGG